MHCRKLHTNECDKEKLLEALKALYRDGVRIPIGIPYELRTKPMVPEDQAGPACEDETDGLELVRDEAPAQGADGDLYGRT